LLAALVVPFVWVPVQAAHLGQFLGLAFFGTLGMTLMTQAFRLAPAAVVAPFDYTALLWATVLGFLFWAEVPDALTFAGAAVIIASGGFIIWRESRQPG
jgi:drug/metabolite transporter (DMT)-like permease